MGLLGLPTSCLFHSPYCPTALAAVPDGEWVFPPLYSAPAHISPACCRLRRSD